MESEADAPFMASGKIAFVKHSNKKVNALDISKLVALKCKPKHLSKFIDHIF